jgi:hypothetical protein
MADLEKLTVTLEANVGKYNADLAQAAKVTAKQTAAMESNFAGLNKQLANGFAGAANANVNAAKVLSEGMSSVGRSALETNKINEKLIKGLSAGAVVTDDLGHAASFASTQAQALFHSIRSVGEGLALGMPLTQVFAQQLNHMSYAASGPGGLTAAFGQVLGIFGKIFTPFRLVATGLAGIAAGAVAAAVSFANAQSKISLALTGIGSAAGVTVKDINGIADRVSAAGDISRSEAADIATAIASTGKVSAEATEKATELAHAYSLVFGKDLTKSAADLAQALADPARGVDDLNARLGAFSDAERQAVKSMAAQNNLAGAQKIITDGLKKSIGDAAAQTTAWARAWDAVTNGASNALTAVGKTAGIVAQDPREALAAAQARLANLQQGSTGAIGRRGFFSDPNAIAAASAEVDKWTKAVEAADKQATETKANAESAAFGDIVRGIDPALSKLKDLEDQLVRINKDLNDPSLKIDEATRTAGQNAAAALSAQIGLEKQYIALAQQRYGITSALLGQSISQSEIDRKAIAARTPEEKAEVAYLQTIKQLREQGASSEEAIAAASMERTKSLDQSYHDLSEAARDRIYQSSQTVAQGEIENQTIGRSVDVATRLTQQFQLLAAARQEAFKNGTTVSVQEQLDALIKADELARQAVENAKKATIASAQFDIAQLGRSQSEQNVYGELQSRGLLDNGEIKSAAAEQAAAILRTRNALQDLADTEKTFASNFLHDLIQGKSAAEALGNALNAVASKLVDLGIDNLISGLKPANSGLLSLFTAANGGVFVPGSGPQALKRYAGGGVSTKAAIFGEAGPEAAVPLPDGRRIPVDLRMPKVAAQPVASAPNINISIDARNSTKESVDALNANTLPKIRDIVRQEIMQTATRSAAFKKAVRT